jgi:hypothetical protein
VAQPTTDLKHEIQKNLGQLKALRDEIKVKVHLAQMDVKDEWNQLEPQLSELERAATDFTETTRRAVTDAVKRLSNLSKKLS